MAAVSIVSSTGNIYLDSLLSGEKWSSSSLGFSFPTNATVYGSGYGQSEPTKNFHALDATQQAAVRKVLADYTGVLKVSFTEQAGSAAESAELRYGESDQVATAWAYTPVSSSEGGDVWLSASSTAFASPVKGGYAWLTLIHETGHTLGLKHAQEAEGANGVMPGDHDTVEYTVMSYRSFAGASLSRYVNGNFDYPQTLMLDDIRALQYMYGANFSRAGADVVYSWNPNTGEMSINGAGQGAPGANRVFMTVWTGGANATYDFSAYGNDLKVDLQPGHWTTTSAAQLAHLDARAADTHLAAGNIANAYFATDGRTNNLVRNAFGGAGNDLIIGNDADNKIRGGGGADQIDGGGGVNTAVYLGASADYQWKTADSKTWTVVDTRGASPDGTDTLTNIGFLQFSDRTVSLASSPSSQVAPAPQPAATPLPAVVPPVVPTPAATAAAPAAAPAAPPPVAASTTASASSAAETAPVAATATATPPTTVTTPATTTTTSVAPPSTSSEALNLLGAYEKILGVAADSPAVAKLANQVEVQEITSTAALQAIIDTAHSTTSVATLTYQFFVGAIPSQEGLNYILSSPLNEGNLNSAYYADFSMEERYINFAVNLGKVGEGRQGFERDYGALSLEDAARKAYKTVVGAEASSADLAHILTETIQFEGQDVSREAAFRSYGGDDLGAKAAMVGWMLSEAVRTDTGVYAHANDAFLVDLADGASFTVDLIGVYGAATA